MQLTAFISAFLTLLVPAQDTQPVAVTVLDFEGESAGGGWVTVNDGIMGGRSTGGPSFADGKLVFSGSTNTDGGGFSSIRTVERIWELGGREGLVFEVRGDGRTYQADILLRGSGRGMSVAYRAPFKTSANEGWTEVRLPFDAFEPTLFGRRIASNRAAALDPAQIGTIGLFIYDGVDGPFRIEVESVRAYGGAADEGQPFATPADAAASFQAFWPLPNGRERSAAGAAWIERAKASDLGDEAYLLPLVRYVFEDYRERPARSREVYESFIVLRRAPASLSVTIEVTKRFVLGPLVSEIEAGELANVDALVPILASSEDVPYRVYGPVGAALRRSPSPGATSALARLIRRAAADERVGDERLVALVELCASVEPRVGGQEEARPADGVAFVHFDGKDIDGNVLSTRGFPGEVVLVDFWATWCGPCLKQSPEIVALAEEFGGRGLRVLGVSLDGDGSEERLREVAQRFDLDWPHLFDGGGWQTEPALLNGVSAIPEIVLIDRSGRARFRGLRGDDLRSRVAELIAEPAPVQDRPAAASRVRGRRAR
ncbi:MAG: CIA30 family protein [Planctomycetota bacterium]